MNGGDTFADNNVVADFLNYNTTGIDVLYGNMNIVEQSTEVRLQTYPQTIDKLYFYKNCIGHQASFIRRTLFEKYGLYNEQHRIVSDWEQWIIFAENNCVFKYWNKAIATFYNNGISSKMSKKHVEERLAVENQYFSKKEQKEAYRQAYRWKSVSLFSCIPLLLVKIKKNGNQWTLNLFNIIPVYKVQSKKGVTKHYLFGVLPWLKIKEQ